MHVHLQHINYKYMYMYMYNTSTTLYLYMYMYNTSTYRRRNSGIVENSGIMEMAEIVFCGLHKYYRTCNIAISGNKLNSTVFPCPYLYMHMYNQQPVNVHV